VKKYLFQVKSLSTNSVTVEKDREETKTNGMGFCSFLFFFVFFCFFRGRENESRRKGERRIDTGMILFEARMKSMTEDLNSIPDTRAVVGKTVALRG
jgi:hypothetical protein